MKSITKLRSKGEPLRNVKKYVQNWKVTIKTYTQKNQPQETVAADGNEEWSDEDTESETIIVDNTPVYPIPSKTNNIDLNFLPTPVPQVNGLDTTLGQHTEWHRLTWHWKLWIFNLKECKNYWCTRASRSSTHFHGIRYWLCPSILSRATGCNHHPSVLTSEIHWPHDISQRRYLDENYPPCNCGSTSMWCYAYDHHNYANRIDHIWQCNRAEDAELCTCWPPKHAAQPGFHKSESPAASTVYKSTEQSDHRGEG